MLTLSEKYNTRYLDNDEITEYINEAIQNNYTIQDYLTYCDNQKDLGINKERYNKANGTW